MNIHFPQVERKSQWFSHLLAAFAAFTMLMLSLSFIRMAELRLSVPSLSMHAVQAEDNYIPAAIPAPLPPADSIQTQAIATPEPAKHTQSFFVPQVVPAPVPSVP